MGIKGFIRSYSASVNKSRKIQAHNQKQAAIDNAHRTTNDILAKQKNMKRLHLTRISPLFNWTLIEPIEPNQTSLLETKALKELNEYKPNFLTKLINLSKTQEQLIKNKVDEARKKDSANYETQLLDYKERKLKWDALKTELENINKLNIQSIDEALRSRGFYKYFDGIDMKYELSSQDEILQLKIKLKNLDFINLFEYKCSQRGVVTSKIMSNKKATEYANDVIASIAIMTMRNLFNILPLNKFLFSILLSDIDKRTGKELFELVYEIEANRNQFDDIDFANIDPSSCLGFLKNKFYKEVKIEINNL